MTLIFEILLRLYPARFRAEFGEEMRSVFLALANRQRSESMPAAAWFVWTEIFGLIRGAVCERGRQILQRTMMHWPAMASAAAGTALACGMHIAAYLCLIPHQREKLERLLEHLAARIFVVCVLAGIAAGQPPTPQQDPAALDLAKSIYRTSFTALREAKSMADMRRIADGLESPTWISVDRFGRTVLTRRDEDRELESVLALPPERRVTEMDIIWAERDSDRLMVLAWMMPSEIERTDPDGAFGPTGERHGLKRATLVRDIFVNLGNGWRRVRHDKLVPNDLVLAVDGTPRIVPPLDPAHRVAPDK